MKKINLIILFSILIIAFLSACSSEEYCPRDYYQQSRDNLEKFRNETFDIVVNSHDLNATELEPVIQNLEAYEGYISNLDVPPCLEQAQSQLLVMNASDIAFVKFRFENGIYPSEEDAWGQALDAYTAEINRLDSCMPNCEP